MHANNLYAAVPGQMHYGVEFHPGLDKQWEHVHRRRILKGILVCQGVLFVLLRIVLYWQV